MTFMPMCDSSLSWLFQGKIEKSWENMGAFKLSGILKFWIESMCLLHPRTMLLLKSLDS